MEILLFVASPGAPMLNRPLNISFWIGNLLISFVVSAVVVLAISGRQQLLKPWAYPIRLGAALMIAIGMGAYLDSPWLGNILLSVATGLLFRYW
jgi:hypothetical protein